MNGDRRAVKRRTLGAVACALVVGLLAVAPAFACTGNRGNISTRPGRADVGVIVVLTGSAFAFGVDAQPISIRWAGQQISQVSPDEAGSFSTQITVPRGAEPGWHQITAVQRQAEPDAPFSASFAFEVLGAPTPAPAPAAPANEPVATPAPAQAAAPVSSGAQASPASPAAATQVPAARQPVPANVQTPAPVQPAVGEPLPAPVTGSAALPTDNGPRIPALVKDTPAAMGARRTVTIESGAPLWVLLPLMAAGLFLFAASSAVVISEVRKRRVRAKVTS